MRCGTRLNDPKKLRILKEILDENGINLGEQDEESTSTKSFDALIESKNLKRETKDKVITVLSEVEKQKIINNLSIIKNVNNSYLKQ